METLLDPAFLAVAFTLIGAIVYLERRLTKMEEKLKRYQDLLGMMDKVMLDELRSKLQGRQRRERRGADRRVNH